MSPFESYEDCLAYEARFDNLDEVAHPAIFDRPEFGELLRHAIARGTPLSRPEVEAKFPEVTGGWEW